jgi:hypothetical protein
MHLESGGGPKVCQKWQVSDTSSCACHKVLLTVQFKQQELTLSQLWGPEVQNHSTGRKLRCTKGQTPSRGSGAGPPRPPLI